VICSRAKGCCGLPGQRGLPAGLLRASITASDAMIDRALPVCVTREWRESLVKD